MPRRHPGTNGSVIDLDQTGFRRLMPEEHQPDLEVLKAMDTTLVIVAVLCIFGVFSLALAYAQVQTRGMLAPGARKVD